jgi:alkanesulfonate monooxygenase
MTIEERAVAPTNTPLRFMWSLSSVGDSLRRSRSMTTMSGGPDLTLYIDFCHHAESCGIESLLMAFNFARPDPIAYSAALAMHTQGIRFLVAVRSGTCSPTYFVQQINTLSVLSGGRVCINVVVGRVPDEQRYYGDFLGHDERYERTGEFLDVCHALWRGDAPVSFAGRYYQVEGARVNTRFGSGERNGPEIYLGGSSPQALDLAARHADCLLTLPESPATMAPRVAQVRRHGCQVGLLVTLVSRRSRAEAIEAATALVRAAGESARQVHDDVRRRSDSVGYATTYGHAMNESNWLSPYLWTGAVPYLGAPSIALVGSADDIVDALEEYRAIGVTQFLFMGHPDLEQMLFFGSEILPRIREREREMAAGTGPG